MAKTIDEYSADYAAAKAAGDSQAMQQANDAANQIRNANGQAAQLATNDIAAVAKANATDNSSSSSKTDLQNYINNMYTAYQKQQLADLERQKQEIDPYYSNVKNQAATTMAQNQNAFNEYAAANGLNSGTGGQAYLARQNVYGNALNAADVARANAYADIAAQESSVAAQSDYQKAQAMYNEMVRQQEAQTAQDQFNQNYALSQQQLAQSQQESSYDKLASSAQLLASIGDFSGYKALYGWTDAQVAAAEAIYNQQVYGTTSGQKGRIRSSSGSSSSRSRSSSSGSSTSSTARGNSISGYSSLGTTAQNIARGMASAGSAKNASSYATRIGEAYESGNITEAEADFLLKSIGY